MVNLKSIVRKYDLEDVNIIDDCYYQSCRQIKKLGSSKLNEELLVKIIQDKLETIGITDYKDIDNISNYYISLQEEELVSKVENSNEEPITVVEKELEIENKDKMEDTMLTTNNTGIDSTIGMSKPKGYKTEIKTLY